MANPAPGYANKPEHRVDLLPESKHIRVTFGGTVIADTTNAIKPWWLISLAGEETPSAEEPLPIEIRSIEIRQRQRQ